MAAAATATKAKAARGGGGGGGATAALLAFCVATLLVCAKAFDGEAWMSACSGDKDNATACASVAPPHPLPAAGRRLQAEEGAYEPSPEEATVLRVLLATNPPFAPGIDALHSPNASSPECLRQSQLFLDALARFELWALHMHDATAKPTSGLLLSGNSLLYGDYDACLWRARDDAGGGGGGVATAAEAEAAPGAGAGGSPSGVRPRYCLARLQPEVADGAAQATRSPRLAAAWERFRSLHVLRSTLDDPGHRIPRVSAVQWGLCVPAGCSAADVRAALERRWQPLAAAAGLRLAVRVAPDDCQTTPTWWPPPLTFVAGVLIFGSLIGLCIAATVKDYRRDDKPVTLSRREQYIHAFSLRRNVRDLFEIRAPGPHEVTAAHGVRAFNALLLLLAHKAMALFYHAFHNRTSMAETVGEMWTVLARGASLYTDPFLLLSGLLSTHALMRTLERDGQLHWRREYAARVLRLLPSLAAIILWCTLVLPWLGSGPQWNLVVRHHAELCKKTWWRNMLFIHNYYGFENMCLTHTHHVGIDAQLFLLAPPLVWMLWKRPRAGVCTAFFLAVVSGAHRYRVTRVRQLTNFVHWSVSVSKLFESANYSYILPSHRATVYLLGMLMGYILLKTPRDMKIKESVAAAGWAAAAACAWASFLQPSFMGAPGYVYDATDAARHSAFAPVGWCLAFCWVLLLAHVGRAGIIGKILSWPGFQVTTRLSYALYLVQFPVFFYNVGSARTDITYSILLLFNMLEHACILLATMALTVFVDLPAQNIRSLLLQKKRTSIISEAPAETTKNVNGGS